MSAALWIRPLVQRPARALASVLGVAVGVAAVLSTALASNAAVSSLTSDVEALAGAARLEVTRPGGVALDALAALRPLCADACLAPVVEGTALVASGDPAGGELVHLLGVDGTAEGGGRGLDFEWRAGAGPEALLTERGVALARATAERLGLSAGGTLELVVQSRRVALVVEALFTPEHLAAAWEHVVVLDVALAQELLGKLQVLDRIELFPRRAGADIEALAAHARALLPAGYRVEPASERRAEGEHLVRSLRFNLTALAGVTALVALVLVATTLATSVVQRRAVIALLRSLGASRAQLALGILSESALIGLAGGVLGVLLGDLGARAIAAGVHGSFATLDENALQGAVELAPGWIAAGLALGLCTALGAAFLPLDEAWRTPPVQGLRLALDERPRRGAGAARAALVVALAASAWLCARLPAWNDRPLGALLAALFLLAILLVAAGPLTELCARLPIGILGPRLGTPLRLAQAALFAARRRAAWAAGAVGVAVALAVAMTTMVGSFRANVIEWTEQALRADLQLRPLSSASGATPGRIPGEVVELAARLFGATNVDPYHQTSATVDGEPIVLGGGVFAVVAREGGVPFLDGRAATEVFADALARGCAVVNEPFARRFHVGAGARVALATPAGTVEREIAGVYRDFSAHTGRVVLDLADYLRLEPDEGAESVAVFLPRGADVERERARLSAALAGRFELEILDHREVRAQVLRIFERTFAVTEALQAIASLVAALAVVLVLSALVRERARELAVVRVLGGSRRQLAALVAGQALFLGLAGALGGLAIGGVVGYVLVAVVNVQSFGWSLRFTLPPAVFYTAGAVLPACLAAGLVPAWLALRNEPQEVLREAD